MYDHTFKAYIKYEYTHLYLSVNLASLGQDFRQLSFIFNILQYLSAFEAMENCHGKLPMSSTQS